MADISELKNEYTGERAFLIGNGPSISNTPLDKLRDEYTFGVNKINRIYSDLDWRPSFFFTGTPPTNDLFSPIESENNTVNHHVGSEIPCILPSSTKDVYGDMEGIYYYEKFKLVHEYCPFHRMEVDEVNGLKTSHLQEYWSEDISNLVYLYHSMYGLAQVAAYMGFGEIYFIGTDLGLEYVNPHMIFSDGLDPHRFEGSQLSYLTQAREDNTLFKSFVNGVALKAINNDTLNEYLRKIIGTVQTAHFTSDYRQSLRVEDGHRYNRELRKSHYAIKRMCEYHDIDVYNATIGGELEVYPRRSIEDVLES